MTQAKSTEQTLFIPTADELDVQLEQQWEQWYQLRDQLKQAVVEFDEWSRKRPEVVSWEEKSKARLASKMLQSIIWKYLEYSDYPEKGVSQKIECLVFWNSELADLEWIHKEWFPEGRETPPSERYTCSDVQKGLNELAHLGIIQRRKPQFYHRSDNVYDVIQAVIVKVEVLLNGAYRTMGDKKG